MEIRATIDYERHAKIEGVSDANDMITGELILTNWDEQVKVEGGLIDTPIYIDRADLLRVIAALEAGSV